MKKKTLVILLIIPFVIALLTFVSFVALTNTVGVDATISWNYRDNEGFKTNSEYKLEATLNYDQSQLLKPGSDTLVWETSGENSDLVEIEKRDDEYYLITGSETGETKITCCTENRRSSLTMTAHIYENGLVLINPVNQSSGTQIDSTRYYGEYDITYDDSLTPSSLTRNSAKIPLEIEVFSDTGDTSYYVLEKTDNISFDQASSAITINNSGEASITFASSSESYITSTYSFNIVDEGINVYSFNDLMMCTNRSTNGEVVVMQVSLESRENALNKDQNGNYIEEYKRNNIKLFGNYDFRNQTFNFGDFLYFQDPKLETKFIDQFLDNGKLVENFDYSTQMKIGIRVQKDFYGNGFTINMHELAYPVHGYIDSTTGKLTPDRNLDYFFGPLTFVSIGDIENLSVIRAFLCDNVGFLVDSDDVIVNDVKLQNSNNIDNMYNLGFTGTVLEVQGKNVTIKNSVIQNGRTCIRAFSTDGLLIDNCLLQNAGEFIVKLGSNKVNSTDHSKTVNINYGGSTITSNFEEFFNGSSETSGTADNILTSIFSNSGTTSEEINTSLTALNDIQNSLDNLNGIVNEDGSLNYDAHVAVNDTYFYNSGVYSIAFESTFNGAYLYNGIPSTVKSIATMFGITPNDIGGTSYPVELTLSGDTRFYDWKNIDQIDISALIEENFSTFIQMIIDSGALEGTDIDLSQLEGMSIDDFFPIKHILKDLAISNGFTYREVEDGTTSYYINRPVAWYGGGYNGSTLINNIKQNEYYSLSSAIDIDFTSDILKGNHQLPGEIGSLISLLSKCVVMAIGTHSFKFITNGTVNNGEVPPLFDEVPSYLDLVL